MILVFIQLVLDFSVPASLAEPINFTLPHDAHVSLIIKSADGFVVRQLLNSERRKAGKHTIAWDGRTTPVWKTPGQAVAAGQYTWSAIYHTGIGLRLRGWAYHGPSDPWDAGPTSYWGGDHAGPISCAADENQIYLGWAGSEAGKALIALNLDDEVQWAAGFHFNSAGLVTSDRGLVYYSSGNLLKRVDAKTGKLMPWPGTDSGEIEVRDLLGGEPGLPSSLSYLAEGLTAHKGKLYLSLSQWNFGRNDILDWRGFLKKVKEVGPVGAAIWNQLDERTAKTITAWLPTDKTADEGLKAPIYYVPDCRNVVVNAVKRLLKDRNFVQGAFHMSRDKLMEANRHHIEKAFPGLVSKARSNYIAVINAKTGIVEKEIPAAAPGRIVAVKDDLFYLFSERDKLLALNPQTGETRLVMDNLRRFGGLTVDNEGNIYIAFGSPRFQIDVFDPHGKLLRSIGKRGGRTRFGPWSPDGMGAVYGLVIDARGRLWAAESDILPKRISVWNPKTGEFIKEFFGPTHYGASGGAINPRDPNLMIGEACEFRIDPKTGRGKMLGLFTLEYPQSFSRFCEGSNGRLYLAGTFKRKGVWQVSIWERLDDADYAYRGVIRTDGRAGKTYFWADRNGDQRAQRSEVQTHNQDLQLCGYNGWSLNMNTDLTFYGVHQGTGYQIRLRGFTTCGAPLYDLGSIRKLGPLNAPMPSPDNRLILSSDERANLYRCYEVETGSLLWTYPNTFHGVHGSHYAPGPQPGLIRGAFGFVGSATLPKPIGAIWAINTNVGEWHVLSESGYYLTRLFQGDSEKWQYPEKAVPGAVLDNIPAGLGGEDFGGSMTQGKDGKLYLQAGKLALWNTEVVGLDSVKELKGGTITISESDVVKAKLARGQGLQATTKPKEMVVRKATPKFTGNVAADFPGPAIRYGRRDKATSTVAAWDEKNLYLAWQVPDETPWKNGADAPEYMYTSGDTVDFQLGTDPAADPKRGQAVRGDLRLSIGNFQGTPTAVLYQPIAPEGTVGKPRTFSSGTVREYKVGSIRVLKSAKIHIALGENAYTIEAVIPLSALGLSIKPGQKLRADFGITHSDPNGLDTTLRIWWNNQATAIINAEVFELKLEPRNWGVLEFSK